MGAVSLSNDFTDGSFIDCVVEIAVDHEFCVWKLLQNTFRVQPKEVSFVPSQYGLIIGNVSFTFQVSSKEMNRRGGSQVDDDVQNSAFKILFFPVDLE